jgi:SAM-dependent methyltransferase
MAIEPLNAEVTALWNSPDKLVDQWESGEHALKVEHEQLVADWVWGMVQFEQGPIADLGCGPGRLVRPLDVAPDVYYGFDGSQAMVQRAKKAHPRFSFTVVDIFQYVSDRRYSVAVMLDVAQHQNRPLDSILYMMQLWDADRYLISLLVGEVKEVLSMSVVVSFTSLLDVTDRVVLNRMYMERCGEENFSWVLLDLSKL